MTDDVNVAYWDLPVTIHGLVRRNEDDSYTVILNSRDSRERNMEAYRHELEHLKRDDFQRDDVSGIETAAHSRGGRI